MLEETFEARSDRLFETRKKTVLEIWDRMQRLQTDFCLAQELAFYHTSPHWLAAKTVLDLGTGNGYYLSKIASRFPAKVYHGVDASTELIALANQESAGGTVSFAHRNLLEVNELHDFVIMRLLLQHVDDIPAVLRHVAGLTNPGGSALIIDAHDPLRSFSPDLPEFTKFFAAYTEAEHNEGRDRRVALRIEQAIASSALWRAAGTLQLLIPSTIAGNLDLFVKTYMLLVDLVECSGKFHYNFASVKEAWQRWSKIPHAYTQVGLNLICLERTAGNMLN
jgi:ubiquinone/menaquinone biosynthesis C-methylase UbiE